LKFSHKSVVAAMGLDELLVLNGSLAHERIDVALQKTDS